MAQIDELYIKLGIKNGDKVRRELKELYKTQQNIGKLAKSYIETIEKQNVKIKNKNKFIKNVQTAVLRAQRLEKKAHTQLLRDKAAASRRHQQMMARMDGKRLADKLKREKEAARKAERLQKEIMNRAWGRGRFRGGSGFRNGGGNLSMGSIVGANLISNAISSFFAFLTRQIRQGYNRFVAVERGIATSQLGLFLQGKYTQVRDKALRDQSLGLSLKYGTNRAQLLEYAGQGLAGGMTPEKMKQAMDAAVRLSISTAKPIDTIFMQINKAINSGYLDETILSVVPKLKYLSTTAEVREKALDIIQKQLARFPDFQDKSLGRATDKLFARFSHWMQKNLEPLMDGIRRGVDYISNILMNWINRGVNIGGITNAIGTFFLHQFRRMGTGQIMENLIPAFETWIKRFLLALNDHIEALVGDPNKTLIAQYLRANNLPVTLWGMIRFWVRQFFLILVEEIKLAFKGFKMNTPLGEVTFEAGSSNDGKNGKGKGKGKGSASRLVPPAGLSGFQEAQSTYTLMQLLRDEEKGKNANEDILKRWEKASKNGVQDVTDPKVKKDLEDKGAMNTNINIYTNQAGEVVKSLNDELVAYYRQYGNVSVVA